MSISLIATAIGLVLALLPTLALVRPVDARHAGDGANRIFGAGQQSAISVLPNESAATSTPPVSVATTPVDPPVVIPPGGGSIAYTVTITNNSSSSETFDLWTRLEGPGGIDRNPLFLRNVTFSPSQTITATRTQNISAGAPAGSYTYYLEAGTSHPNADLDGDSFFFDKSATPLELKVAFIGDQGLGVNADAVLSLIQSEGAAMILHQGDFDYQNNPDAWDQQINDILGPSYPYFASIGNHDVSQWSGYQGKLQDRLDKIPGAVCLGDLGVKSACRYQGLFFILSGAGTMGSDHDTYIRDQLAADDSIWSVCSWHKNQTSMQAGSKPDEVGWGPYEECRKGGAIIATGHEHSYHRTRTLTNTETQTIDASCEDDPGTPDPDVCVFEGSTFVFVSGIGGRSIRDQDRCLPTTYPYGCNGEWAKIYTSDQGGQHGALFITFGVDGDPNKADGYFKNIDGVVVDSFTISAASGG